MSAPPGIFGLYAVTIFVGAFLLFQVQPLIAKFILPWFGGSPAVWTACMLFFQVALLAGYGYAHLALSRLGRRQWVVQVALLALALATLPIVPGERWKPRRRRIRLGGSWGCWWSAWGCRT